MNQDAEIHETTAPVTDLIEVSEDVVNDVVVFADWETYED